MLLSFQYVRQNRRPLQRKLNSEIFLYAAWCEIVYGSW